MSVTSSICAPEPSFTEKELPDQTGRVALITGSTSGVGRELASLLYSRNATLYIHGRSHARVNNAIDSLRAAHQNSTGHLEPFVADLADLATIKPAVKEFLRKERRLDVLVLNAGVMMPLAGSRTVQGHDLEMGTNCLSHFLLATLLGPIMRSTAAAPETPKASVRVVWVSSTIGSGARKGGVELDVDGKPKILSGMANYMQSKGGDVLLAGKFARTWAEDKVLSVSLHPGLMKTDLQRNFPKVVGAGMGLLMKPSVYGAYTELFAGFSPEIVETDNGGFFIPWGRRGTIPDHMQVSLKSKAESGTGLAERFYEWCEAETRAYI